MMNDIKLSAKGLTYDSELESFDVDWNLDEIELLRTAIMCLELAMDAIKMSSNTKNYFTENNELYLNLINAIRNNIKERI